MCTHNHDDDGLTSSLTALYEALHVRESKTRPDTLLDDVLTSLKRYLDAQVPPAGSNPVSSLAWVVFTGKTTGVFSSSFQASLQTTGVSHASQRRYDTYAEAQEAYDRALAAGEGFTSTPGGRTPVQPRED